MSVDHGYFYTDGSCLVNDMLSKGTLLVNIEYFDTTDKFTITSDHYFSLSCLMIIFLTVHNTFSDIGESFEDGIV